MLRALVLIAALIFFRTFFSRKRQRSTMAVSPYVNSLDGMMSAEQISQALDDFEQVKSCALTRSPGPRLG